MLQVVPLCVPEAVAAVVAKCCAVVPFPHLLVAPAFMNMKHDHAMLWRGGEVGASLCDSRGLWHRNQLVSWQTLHAGHACIMCISVRLWRLQGAFGNSLCLEHLSARQQLSLECNQSSF